MGDGNQAPGKGRGRSRNCGTPQGAAQLARGASAVKWDMGYGIWDMGYGIWDKGAESNGGSPKKAGSMGDLYHGSLC